MKKTDQHLADQHLELETLRDWIHFQLDTDQIDRVDEHLIACDECAQRLEDQLRITPLKLPQGIHNSIIETIYTHDTKLQPEYAKTVSTGDGKEEPESRTGVAPHFKKRSLHGVGGIGMVWRAYDSKLNRVVALKELQPEVANSVAFQKRFIREAQITGRLEHPGIVPIYQLIHHRKKCYYSMRFIRGHTLTDKIASYHASEREYGGLIHLLEQFVQICNAIAYAHSNNVIHRDLKSDNIVVGKFGEVIVVDWGLAKYLNEDDEVVDQQLDAAEADPNFASLKTLAGQRMGTPAFMSPEQARGENDQTGTHTDVYGMSTILYEILTGRPPFVGKSVDDTLEQVVNNPPRSPLHWNRQAPSELVEICLQGLAKAPDQRCESVRCMGKFVHEWIMNQAAQKRSHEIRQRFFDLSADLMAILDERGQICECNRAWETTLGWSQSDLTGQSHLELMHPDDRDGVLRIFRDTKRGIATQDFEVRFQHKSGNFRWILWNVTPFESENGTDHQTYVIGRDITERKELALRFAGLFEGAPDAIIIFDRNAEIQMVNQQTVNLFGYQRNDLVGKKLTLLAPGRRHSSLISVLSRYAEAPKLRPMGKGLKITGLHADGSEFPMEISLSPVDSNDQLLIFGTVRKRVVKTRSPATPK